MYIFIETIEIIFKINVTTITKEQQKNYIIFLKARKIQFRVRIQPR